MRSRMRIRASVASFVAIVPGLLCIAGPAPATEGSEPPPIPHTKGLDYYLAIVDAALPAFSTGMLSVPTGPDWMAGKTVHDVAMAMQDSDPGRIVYGGSVVMGYDPPDGPRCIKLDFNEGYIRFMNRNRSHHLGSPCVAVPMNDASTALTATAGALGIPTSEWDSRAVDLVMERSVHGEAQDPVPELACEAERIVTMTRKAPNGYPVFDSRIRESISNLHERARLRVDWPQFKLQTNLVMRGRAEVVTDLAQRILNAEKDLTGFGAEVDLEIRLGYARTTTGHVPVARVVFADIYDRYEGLLIDAQLAWNPNSNAPGSDAPTGVQFAVRVDPIGGSAAVDFYLPRAGTVRLTITDVAGRRVANLTEADYSQGWHQVSWNLRDREGQRVPAGIYFARMEAGREASIRKILVIR